jgi:DsbC/DsbD-like thiol-disulfide interchange protein
MRASSRIRIHAPRRVDSTRRAVRSATIALALAVLQIASASGNLIAKAHAQGLVPALPSEPDPKDLVHAELVSDVSALAPGHPFQLAVRLAIKEGWHLNWLNPGDAGLAPDIAWKVPKGFKTSIICWPYPERFKAGPLVIFGFGKELLLVTEVTPAADLRPGGTVDLGAEISWLACEEACIPGSASLSLKLPVEETSRPEPNQSAQIEAWRARCPGVSGPWNVDASLGDDATLLLDLQTADQENATINKVFFFPYQPGVIENAMPQLLSVEQGPQGRTAYQLRIELWRMATQVPDRLHGVLVIEGAEKEAPHAIEVDVPLRSR